MYLYFQIHHYLRLANELNEAHVLFKDRKMKGYLSSQLFSRSVANSLQWFHSQNQIGFTDPSVLLTADFCEFMNNLFDFFNSKRLSYKNQLAPTSRPRKKSGIYFLSPLKLL